MRHVRRLSIAVGAIALAALVGCGEQNPVKPAAPEAVLAFVAMAPAYVSTISVTVTGPGIDSALVFNYTLVNGTAAGTMRLPAGAGRRIVAQASDEAGVTTHRGETTVTLYEGSNPPITFRLTPLLGNQPITITVGSNVVVVSGVDTTLTAGDSLQLTATALNEWGQPVSSDQISWASSSPAFATVSASGLVQAQGLGVATIVVTYGGVARGRRITVVPLSSGWLVYAIAGRIYRAHPDGSGVEVVREPLSGWNHAYHAVSPDGQSVAFTGWSVSTTGGANRVRVVVVPTAGGGETVVFDSTGAGQGLFGPAWAPDGQRLVFSWQCATCGLAQIFTINLDGTGIAQLTSDDSLGGKRFPTWSPDGQRIAFNCFPYPLDPRDICVVGADGSGVTRVTSDGSSQEAHPAWLTSSRLVFRWDKTGSGDIYAINLDGSGLAQLTANSVSESWPRPSPDGKRIVFWGTPPGQTTGLYVVGINGRGLYRVPISDVGGQPWPSWAP